MTDGRRDFDFLLGDWDVTHRSRRRRLAGDNTWDSFTGTMSCRAILGGLGNIDEFLMPSRSMIGSTLRLFDLAEQQWSLHWASSLTGRLEPPLQGRFDHGVGVFYGGDRHAGHMIQVRFIWDGITRSTARWQQAFSPDGRQSWETNWVMQLQRSTSAVVSEGLQPS